jgi:hypothetical protein
MDHRRAPAWTYAARGVLWRLEVGAPGFLVGEDRSLEVKEVSYFCLDRATGLPRWEGLVPIDRWWSGIEAVTGSVVLFHGYASPDMPLHRGITALDLASGSVRWQLPQARFLQVEGGAVVAAMGAGEIVRLNVETGAALGEGADSGLPSRRAPEARWPEPLVEDPRLDPSIRGTVPETALRESMLGVRGDTYCVLAYSERASSGTAEELLLRTTLVLFGGPPWTPLYTEIVQEAARTVIPEPFFCQDGMLYFVKNLSMLVAVSLPTTEPMPDSSA